MCGPSETTKVQKRREREGRSMGGGGREAEGQKCVFHNLKQEVICCMVDRNKGIKINQCLCVYVWCVRACAHVCAQLWLPMHVHRGLRRIFGYISLSLSTSLSEARSLPELRARRGFGLFLFSLTYFSARMVAGKSWRVSYLFLP